MKDAEEIVRRQERDEIDLENEGLTMEERRHRRTESVAEELSRQYDMDQRERRRIEKEHRRNEREKRRREQDEQQKAEDEAYKAMLEEEHRHEERLHRRKERTLEREKKKEERRRKQWEEYEKCLERQAEGRSDIDCYEPDYHSRRRHRTRHHRSYSE